MKNLKNWNKGDPCTSEWIGISCSDKNTTDGYLHITVLYVLFVLLLSFLFFFIISQFYKIGEVHPLEECEFLVMFKVPTSLLMFLSLVVFLYISYMLGLCPFSALDTFFTHQKKKVSTTVLSIAHIVVFNFSAMDLLIPDYMLLFNRNWIRIWLCFLLVAGSYWRWIYLEL